MTPEHDYDLSKKVKISFKGLDYYVMPRYKEHYLNNEYERFSLQILKNSLSSNSLFVDIGAHYGAYSLYAASAAGSNVMAIEPVAENFQLLKDNIQANKLGEQIEAFDYAASNENGEAEFNIPWASDSAGFYSHPNAQTIRKQKVITRKIDDVIGSRKADVIKIDTEGHEIGVLEGLTKTLKNNSDTQLIIEINPPLLQNAGTSADALLEMVQDLGKEIYMVDEDAFSMHRITDRLEAWPKYINAGNYANLYCVPAADHQYLLFVSHSAEMGGAEMAMYEQIVALRKKNIFAHVVLPNDGPLVKKLVEAGIGHSIIDGLAFWVESPESIYKKDIIKQRSLAQVRASLEIEKLVTELNPTAIVNNSMVNPWGYIAAKAHNLPLIWMIHEYGDLDHGIPFAHGVEATRKFISKSADLIVSCSDAVKKEFLKSAGSNANVHTVYNLLRAEKIVTAAEEPVKSPYSTAKTLKLCTVGTLSEGKGQLHILDALQLLQSEGINAELIIVGQGSKKYQSFLKKKVKEYGLDSAVTFLGQQSNPYPFIARADAVIVASRNEAFGRVAAEAMMLGVPVIASDKGGSLELVEDKKTGLLFESENARSLAQTIKNFQSITTKDRQAMTRLAKLKVQRVLDTEKNTQKLVDLIAQVASRSAGSKRGAMVSEMTDALNAYAEELSQAKAELAQAQAAASEQQRVNTELLAAIEEMRGSQSYRLARKLSKVKHTVKKSKG